MNEQTSIIEADRLTKETTAKVMISGDLSRLNDVQKAEYYAAVCKSVGLNPLTKPFEFISLNGKLRLYALRDCTDQLRRLYGISIYIQSREKLSDIYVVTARAKDKDGREDESTGAVTIGHKTGDDLCNQMMKAETKAKRRVTLSIAGLGWLDETELETIPSARVFQETDAPEQKALEEHSQDPADSNPTKDQVDSLFELAKQTDKELRDFGNYVRGVMGIEGDFRLTKRLLREQMSMHQYNLAWTHFANALKESVEGDESDVPYFVPSESPQSDFAPSEPLLPLEGAQREASAQPEGQVFATSELITTLWDMAYQSSPDLVEKVRKLMSQHPNGIPIESYEECYQEIAAKVKEG